jgi:ABC-type multidrug transport system fused ATPase/permease subunit
MGENQHRESEDSPTGVHDVLPTASGTKHEQTTGLEDTTIDPGRPRAWHTPMFAASSRLWKQSLGLNPFKGSYFGLYTVLNGHYDRIIAACGGLFAVAAGVPLPIIGVIFGKIISTFPPDEQELQTRIIQLLSVAVAYFVVTAAYTTIFSRTGERIAIQLRQRVLRTLIYVEQSYLDVQDLDFNALMRDNIDTIQVGCSEKIGIFIQSMSYFVAAFAVGFILNPKLTGILFAAVIPSMVAVVSFGSTSISKLTRRISEHTEKANTIVLSALRGIRVVQAFDMISNICDSHRQNLDECSRLGLRKAIASALELGGAYFVAYSANGLAFYVGSRMAAAGEAGGDAGTIYAVVFLILDASFVVGQFAPFLEIFARAAAAYGKVQGLLDACLERNGEGGRTPLDIPFDIMGKEVRFQNVAFAYPARSDVQVLKGLDLVLQPGTFNAIVG